jgi:Na+/H+-dicarboxylate symporter
MKMKKPALHWMILLGLLMGILWAILSAEMGWQKFTADWLAPWGDVFINILKLIALPLVFFSIVVGVASLTDLRKLGRIGGVTMGAYMFTTVLAVSLGLVLVNLVNPGKYASEDRLITNRISYEFWVEGNDKVDYFDYDTHRLLSNEAYSEYFEAARLQNEANADADIVTGKHNDLEKTKDSGPLQALVDIVPSNVIHAFDQDKGTMLQIIFFAIFFGVCLSLIDKGKASAVNNLFDAFNDVFVKMVNVVMAGAPFFVFALMAGKMGEMAGDDPNKVLNIFATLGAYSLVVIAGLLIMTYVFYPLFLIIFMRKKITYRKFFKGISRAQITAFSTSSSAATLPVTLECVHELGVSKRISDFVLPIGATVNMDGTSLYQAVAVVFLAQYHMIELDFITQLTIVATATLASIGSAAIPSAGLIMMMLILESVDLNPAWIAIIFPVDRILDMCRTVVNVTGDTVVCTIVANREGEFNPAQPETHTN